MKQWWINLNKTDVRNLLAFVWVVATTVMLYILIFKGIPTANNELLYMSIGMYMTYTGVIISWYFGSSKSETDKAKTDI